MRRGFGEAEKRVGMPYAPAIFRHVTAESRPWPLQHLVEIALYTDSNGPRLNDDVVLTAPEPVGIGVDVMTARACRTYCPGRALTSQSLLLIPVRKSQVL